jgi:hypothetical protein
MELHNDRGRPARVRLEALLATARPEPAEIVLEAAGLHHVDKVDARPSPLALDLRLDPGAHRLRWRCSGRPLTGSDDPRELVFRLQDFRLQLGDEDRT